MKFYMVASKRPWVPRYAIEIFNERGQLVDSQKFLTKIACDRWVEAYKREQMNMIFSRMVS